ncbi:hypothetical protein [Piscinibacter koreensis]|nr:hypothetical protein [Schlegelella koreensis]
MQHLALPFFDVMAAQASRHVVVSVGRVVSCRILARSPAHQRRQA